MSKNNNNLSNESKAGYSLVEVVAASAISILVILITIGFLVSSLSYWHEISASVDADNEADLTLSYFVYGVAGKRGLRGAVSDSVKITEIGDGWELEYKTSITGTVRNKYIYSESERTLSFEPGGKIIGSGVALCEVRKLEPPEPEGLEVKIEIEAQDGSKTVKRNAETILYFRN